MLGDLVVENVGRHGDDRQRADRRIGVGADALRRLDAVDAGQADVHENKIERLHFQQFEPFFRGGRDQRPVTHPGDEGLHHHRVHHVVLDDEDIQRPAGADRLVGCRLDRRLDGGFALWQRQRHGEATSVPGSVSTSTRPPIAVTSRLEIAKPSPVPVCCP